MDPNSRLLSQSAEGQRHSDDVVAAEEHAEALVLLSTHTEQMSSAALVEHQCSCVVFFLIRLVFFLFVLCR